jgi:hypothetical protein
VENARLTVLKAALCNLVVATLEVLLVGAGQIPLVAEDTDRIEGVVDDGS